MDCTKLFEICTVKTVVLIFSFGHLKEMTTPRDCNNTYDPITLDTIEEICDQYIIDVPCGNITNCYDVRSLTGWMRGTQKIHLVVT